MTHDASVGVGGSLCLCSSVWVSMLVCVRRCGWWCVVCVVCVCERVWVCGSVCAWHWLCKCYAHTTQYVVCKLHVFGLWWHDCGTLCFALPMLCVLVHRGPYVVRFGPPCCQHWCGVVGVVYSRIFVLWWVCIFRCVHVCACGFRRVVWTQPRGVHRSVCVSLGVFMCVRVGSDARVCVCAWCWWCVCVFVCVSGVCLSCCVVWVEGACDYDHGGCLQRQMCVSRFLPGHL